MVCPECGSEVELSGKVHCLCDKDFCLGQRCGADDLFLNYTCKNEACKKTGTPSNTELYIQVHCK